MGKKTVAVIDVGSNSVRACVYDVKESESRFTKIVDVSKAIGLAGYFDDAGAMSKEGIDAGCRALSKMVRLAELAGSEKIAILATGAVRNCSNTEQVAKALSKKAGCPVRVLSGDEEALMSAAGASWSTGVRTGLFFDLGGGSTELAVMRKGRIVAMDSIPIGALSSWKRASNALFTGAEELEAIETGFEQLVQASHVRISAQTTVVGIGGSMRLASKVACSLKGEAPGNTLTTSDLDAILDAGTFNSEGLYRIVLKIKPERVHTFLPACAIARAIMRNTDCSEMVVSKAGLREGCLLSELNAGALPDFARI